MNLSVQHKILTLKKNADIEEVLSYGKKIHTKYGLFFLYNLRLEKKMSFAVLIKKKIGNAVWRNYCKRLVREYVRNRIMSFNKYKKIIFLYTYEGKINYSHLEKEFDKKLKAI
jgi:ribonuclease P protein component